MPRPYTESDPFKRADIRTALHPGETAYEMARATTSDGAVNLGRFYEPPRYRSPDHELRMSVLDLAVADYRATSLPGKEPMREQIKNSAIEFFASDDDTYPLSFVSICEALRISPSWFRRELGAPTPLHNKGAPPRCKPELSIMIQGPNGDINKTTQATIDKHKDAVVHMLRDTLSPQTKVSAICHCDLSLVGYIGRTELGVEFMAERKRKLRQAAQMGRGRRVNA